MALANITKNIPPFGKPFFRTEDEFISYTGNYGGALFGGGLMKTSTGNISTNGDLGNAPQEIIICCKNKKRRIHGYLSEGVKLTGQSEWKEMFNDGILSVATQAVNALDTGLQAFQGSSIQQPYMQRKMWVKSSPFNLNFTFTLVADQDTAENDVYLPAQALMSFIYPRNLNAQDTVKKKAEEIGFINADGYTTGGHKNLIGALIDLGGLYAIPGPALGYSSKDEGKDNNGDSVTITVGNMFAFGSCYLKSVDLEFSPTIDHTGYPIWCKCTINAEAMDACYCDVDGNFLISQYQKSADAMNEMISSIKDTVTQAATDLMNIAKTTINAIGIGSHES